MLHVCIDTQRCEVSDTWVENIQTKNVCNFKETGWISYWGLRSCNSGAHALTLCPIQLAMQPAAYFKRQVDMLSYPLALSRHSSTLLLTSGSSSIATAAVTVTTDLSGCYSLALKIILWFSGSHSLLVRFRIAWNAKLLTTTWFGDRRPVRSWDRWRVCFEVHAVSFILSLSISTLWHEKPASTWTTSYSLQAWVKVKVDVQLSQCFRWRRTGGKGL
jgi:hypothetical protein